MTAEPFATIVLRQLPGACGPTSLSSCLFLLGHSASPRELARAAGKDFLVFCSGLDENDIARAARAHGVNAEFFIENDRGRGAAFSKKVVAHLRRGLPAILCVWDYAHWVAAVGLVGDKIAIMDPYDGARTFSWWTPAHLARSAWNASDEEDGDPAGYFAILLDRADGGAPRFKVTAALARLQEHGSVQTAGVFADDLADLAQRAGGDIDGADTVPIADVLMQHRDMLLRTVKHWTSSDAIKVTYRDVRALYDDYVTIAAATGARIAKNANQAELAAQLAVILTTYAFTGEL